MKSAMNKDKLKAIFDELPEIDCQGECTDFCGVAPYGPHEDEFIREEEDMGALPEPDADLTCNQLTEDGRCAIHPVRPLICRLYGLVKDPRMRCPHGCEPEQWLDEEDARALMDVIIRGAPDTKLPDRFQVESSHFMDKVQQKPKE